MSLNALGFLELMPLLQLQPVEAPPLDELPNEQLMELLQALDADLELRESQLEISDHQKDYHDDDFGGHDPVAGSEDFRENRSQSTQPSARVRTYTARKVCATFSPIQEIAMTH